MLNFVKAVFRGFFDIILWLNLILCTIGGAVFANMTYSVGRSGTSGIHPVAGGIIGFILGLLINIVGGGLIATILNIDETLEEVRSDMRRFTSSGSLPNSGNVSSSLNQNPVPFPKPVSGNTWYCKKCATQNSINSSSCKGCGEYR